MRVCVCVKKQYEFLFHRRGEYAEGCMGTEEQARELEWERDQEREIERASDRPRERVGVRGKEEGGSVCAHTKEGERKKGRHT